MIGQKVLQKKITDLIENNTFPRFTIIEGPRGGGKSMIAEYVARLLGCHFVRLDDTSVASLRDITNQAYKLTEPTLYLIPNVQNMSTIAQNSLLKFTEEPPNSAYIVITVESKNQVLDTIRSRGYSLHLDNYSEQELKDYAELNNIIVPESFSYYVYGLCETPAELDYLNSYGFDKFFDFLHLVYNKIGVVSGANALKIANNINLTNDTSDDKVELRMFWKGFINLCMTNIMDDPVRNATAARITSKHLQTLRTAGINKQMCFDTWLLDIRQEWL